MSQFGNLNGKTVIHVVLSVIFGLNSCPNGRIRYKKDGSFSFSFSDKHSNEIVLLRIQPLFSEYSKSSLASDTLSGNDTLKKLTDLVFLMISV